MRNYQGALLAYNECRLLSSEHSKVYLRTAQCYKKLNNSERCAENLEMAVKIEMESVEEKDKVHLVDHMLNLAALYLQNLNNNERAMYYAEAVHEKDKTNSGARMLMGKINDINGKTDKAIELLESVYKIPSFAFEASFRLGKLYEKMNNDKKATFFYKNALALKKSHFESL